MTPMPARPITVLQLCEHFGNAQSVFHGVARSFELWLPAFDAARFRVLLCSRRGCDPVADARFRAAGIQPLYLGYGKRDPRNLTALLRLLRRERVDIIHAHGYGACTWGRVAGHLRRMPVIVHERCNYVTVPPLQRPVEWLLGPFTRHAFAVSESTRRFTIEKRYIPATVVRTLYSGIPLDHVARRDAAWIAAARAAEDTPPDAFLFGVVGRLEAHKGHGDAFAALARVRERAPAARLWVIGDGGYGDTLKARARELGLTGAVRFLGYRPNAPELAQCLDVQVFPSHQEGTPNTLYEAMAVGRAAAASTADGQGEILRHERDALLHTPGDVATLAANMARLHDDAALRARLAAALHARVTEFDMRHTIRTLEDTYTAIMAARCSA